MDALKSVLLEINSYILHQLNSSIPLVNALIEHSFKRTGKNIRARMMIQLAKALGERYPQQDFLKIASIIELIHCGTLVHDDVIDQNSMRRNQLTTHEVFGNTCSILLGDYFFTKAYLIAQDLLIKDLFLPELAKTAHALVEGELLQLQLKHQLITLKDYFNIIQAKTASLFGFSCKSVAQLYAPQDQELFYNVGFEFGVLFQLIDDYQDYFATEKILGKPPGQDFKEQKMTLPALMLAEVGKESLLKSFFETILDFDVAVETLQITQIPSLKMIAKHVQQCEQAIRQAKVSEFMMPLLKDHLAQLTCLQYEFIE